MVDHPKYPRDTIQEAFCEFRLRPQERPLWNPKTPGSLFKALGPDQFPGMEPINEIGVNLVVNPSGQAQQQLVQAPMRFRYSNVDETRLVQASPIMYAFNVVRNYPGWVEFQQLVLKNWEIVKTCIEPAAIERIGLRYINRIPAPAESRLNDWLKHSPYVPPAIDQANHGIKYRLESSLTPNDTVIVTVLRDPMLRDAQGSLGHDILLDIDRVRLNADLPDGATLRDITKALHDEIWDIFEAAKSDRFEAYLKQQG